MRFCFTGVKVNIVVHMNFFFFFNAEVDFFSIFQEKQKSVLKESLWSYCINIVQNESFSHKKLTTKVLFRK